MAETFSWMEGQVYVWTGSATASAVVAYAQDMQGALVRGWDNRARADGSYSNALTGRRADITIHAMFTYDATLLRINESATAVHVHLKQSNALGSAGYFLYSGRIDRIDFQGSEGNPYVYGLAYHANVWSAYGSAS